MYFMTNTKTILSIKEWIWDRKFTKMVEESESEDPIATDPAPDWSPIDRIENMSFNSTPVCNEPQGECEFECFEESFGECEG